MIARRCTAGGWRDTAAGPLVRPYAMTRGRTRASGRPPAGTELRRSTLVVAAAGRAEPAEWSADHDRILRLSRRPISLGDLAEALDVPLMVLAVLVTDLLASGRLEVPLSAVREPDTALLQAVLDGIRRL